MVTVVKILTAAIGVHVSLAITWEVTIIPALVSLYVQCIVSSYVSYKMLMNVLGIMVAVNRSASIKMDHSIAHAG